MKIVFKNENKRFKLNVVDEAGAPAIASTDVQKIQVLLKNEFKGDTWLDYRYPEEEGKPPVILENGVFYFEITTEQVATAKQGNIIVVVNYQVTDTTFSEGVKSFTQKGKLLLIQDV